MHSVFLSAALLLTTALPLLAQDYEYCRHEAQRSATINASGAARLMVEAGPGSLTIEGKPGLDRVVIRGRACASSAALLREIELRSHRSGSDVVVSAMRRDRGWSFRNNEYARLDVVIEVPARMAAEITDGSGSIDVAGLGALRITDGSGEIVGRDLHGDVHIHDSSGGIRLTDLAGGVEIRDGSGSIELRNVGGMIDITDGSGEVDIRGARNSVRISDGSGGIEVDDVAGDFTVKRDGSGSISHANVRGRVEIPRRRGRRDSAR